MLHVSVGVTEQSCPCSHAHGDCSQVPCSPMIHTAFILCVWRTLKCIVPLQNIARMRVCLDIWHGLLQMHNLLLVGFHFPEQHRVL